MHRVQHSPQQALAQSTGVPHVPIKHITTEAGKQVAPVHSRLTFNFAILLLYRSTDDRQSGTLPSRPGEPEYAVMSGAWLLEGTFEAYLYRGMFLEQLSNAMRGSEIRGIELADRFCKSYGRCLRCLSSFAQTCLEGRGVRCLCQAEPQTGARQATAAGQH